MTSTPLQFDPLKLVVDPTFWQQFGTDKLHKHRLDDSDLNILGFYEAGGGQIPTQFCLSSAALLPADQRGTSNYPPANSIRICGTLKNCNTRDALKAVDKNQLFKSVSQIIWEAILDGRAVQNPQEHLNRFLLVSFADLKKYQFHYMAAVPAFMLPPITEFSIKCLNQQSSLSIDRIKEHRSGILELGFFLIDETGSILPLSAFNPELKHVAFGFVDPSSQGSCPGWPLRNFLVLIRKFWAISGTIEMLCYRCDSISLDPSQSLVVSMKLDKVILTDTIPPAVGWEKDNQGRLAPRCSDLGNIMDPVKLADTQANMNLVLMRWRLMPELALEKIFPLKCLLLGAGTLGCYAARCLLGWGIRNFTFVDNGDVSYSNTVRQPLFNFRDYRQSKASVAAENLRQILPSVNAVGINMTIPMPGHHITSDQEFSDNLMHLEQLIETHDVVFLMTDSRESRWLPTVLCAAKQKLAINVALGFDTYLVMRHGFKDSRPQVQKLGCYFCNDVVAPTDSLKDRTLDQQCTVTRPGLAAIAAAIGAELMVNVIQHPDQGLASADTTMHPSEPASTPLGLVPHQIRGFLSHFSNMLIVGSAYDQCTACSDIIIKHYKKDGIDFVKRAIKEPKWLEELSGLKQLHETAEALDHDCDWSEADD